MLTGPPETATASRGGVVTALLLERVGMRREGHLVESEWFKGEWTSEYRYALLRREWVHRPAATG